MTPDKITIKRDEDTDLYYLDCDYNGRTSHDYEPELRIATEADIDNLNERISELHKMLSGIHKDVSQLQREMKAEIKWSGELTDRIDYLEKEIYYLRNPHIQRQKQ
jgi:predicted  nucleic acid-binding Zn-ribbon protein